MILLVETKNHMNDRCIDDTTLRDGVQMPGIRAPSPEERLEIARLLSKIGVERIEMFGTWYDIDRQSAKLVLESEIVDKTRVAIWVRANKVDIDDALRLPNIKEVGISHPISDIHLKYKLQIDREAAYKRIEEVVQYAIDHGLTVFYHGEDCTRADWNFELKIIKLLEELKVDTYRICDTVGVGSVHHTSNTIPISRSIPDKVEYLCKNFKLNFEFHGHDDLGNAVSNTLIALVHGCKWASTTMLGIGERSGNAESEKVIMNLKYHHGVDKYDVKYLTEVCQKISKAMEITIPANKAIVGINAFTHQSGIHTAGIIQHPETYEPFPPESVGNKRRLLVGPYSGKQVIYYKIKELDPNISDKDSRVKNLINYLQNHLFGSGIRKSALTDDEFKEIARKFAII
ncbi:MAG: LeuA family protein [Candidatus Helarchaeota archaeon]